MDLRGRCRRFFAKQQSDKGLVVLDYLQLMDAAGKIENRQQEVSAISRALKGIAREFKVPVLALSQLSRDVEKRGGSKKPQLSDLRDSGAIEQDADMVIFLYREAYYAQEESQDSTAEVIVAKNRNGPTGKVNLVFFKEYARFENGIGMNM
jgi:replicative DNA helicase